MISRYQQIRSQDKAQAFNPDYLHQQLGRFVRKMTRPFDKGLLFMEDARGFQYWRTNF